MSMIELPHTAGCLVCGTNNTHGLHLHLFVDPDTGHVRTTFTPGLPHIGFQGIVHGGILATVLDEAMVWAATWAGQRFCVCAELTTRFRQVVQTGKPVHVLARVIEKRSRLITTSAEVTDGQTLFVAATAKYTPVSVEAHQGFCQTFVDSPATRRAAAFLAGAVGAGSPHPR